MAWAIKLNRDAKRLFLKLDKQIQKKIGDYLDKIQKCTDPREFGKPLCREKNGFWRYRIDDYRVICKIFDKETIILIILVAHRKKVYKIAHRRVASYVL